MLRHPEGDIDNLSAPNLDVLHKAPISLCMDDLDAVTSDDDIAVNINDPTLAGGVVNF